MATPRGAATFRATADAYDRHIGRYGPDLARALCDAAGVAEGQRAVDVGCGPGALASELVRRLGIDAVAAVDPSPSFVEGCRARLPGLRVEEAAAERLPFPDASFDRALAQLVVNFMTDPPAGVGEMVRVTRPGGVVGAAVWDYAGAMTLLRAFWDAAVALDPAAAALDEGRSMPFCTRRTSRGCGRAPVWPTCTSPPSRRRRTTTGSTTSGARWRRASRPRAPTCWAWTSTAARHSRTSCSAGSASGRGRSASPLVPGWRRASGRRRVAPRVARWD